MFAYQYSIHEVINFHFLILKVYHKLMVNQIIMIYGILMVF